MDREKQFYDFFLKKINNYDSRKVHNVKDQKAGRLDR